MTKQAVTHGFIRKSSREIKEIKTVATVYEHEKSGAQLLHLACDDSNKVFCMAFKTIPEDDTGCPHILEHSVLNGSKNFPGKSTFMELIKGSMHTFINAMTASDMTMYPVGSTNDKDFLNLTRVYLDAVLFPKIYEQPNILHQEGWHYELNSPDDELKVRGVVYNEMKGAFSSVDTIIFRHCQQAQFPDTPYGFESGGDPDAILQLDYDKFIAFHQKYYHPSNSKIVIYGDMELDATLELIDKDYLSHFERSADLAEMPPQKPFARQIKLEKEYPADEHKDIADQYHLSLNYSYGQITDPYTADALSVLAELLMTSPASPLKQKIMASGLAADSFCYPSVDILQPTLIFIFKQLRKENIEALVKLVNDELKRIVREGFDKSLIEAVLNKREFFLREAQMQRFPKGLYYIWTSLPLWMHGGDPCDALSFEPQLKELRKGLTEPYFENLIDTVLLNNRHSSQITFVPVPGLLGVKEQELRDKLAARKAKMSKDEIDSLVEFNRKFAAWQQEEVSAEDLARIPKLDLADINPKSDSYPLELDRKEDYCLLRHPVNTNGIVYLKAYVDLRQAAEEDFSWLSLYSYLVGKMDSAGHSYAELSNLIDTHTGGISLALRFLSNYQDPDEILTRFVISGKAVAGKVETLAELAAEFACRPVFEDGERLCSVIRELKTRMEMQLGRGGVSVAITRMFAPFSQLHRFQDQANGMAYYHFLCDLEKRLQNDLPDVRVGLASGPVLQREADVFGPVVNMASRLVTLAFPATVLCSAEVRQALEGDVDFAWRDIGNRKVKDIGKVQGVRSNQLFGLGIVVGLDGTGDSQQAVFTSQALLNLLAQLGVNVDGQVRTLDEFFNRLIVVDRRVAVIPSASGLTSALAIPAPSVVTPAARGITPTRRPTTPTRWPTPSSARSAAPRSVTAAACDSRVRLLYTTGASHHHARRNV